ncbi:probable serine/threonine-protein kinase tsuA isoform X4 [Wyeomyia smithii]|uniref:probable serine/threonine-protein kinase tsuA isoform X4 n=1 Tax=Wyeomyia smithii TaxID=174621 RepID=UPI002467D8D9|nr:probable serine/threonine-protein kinase tsuA isoform X4 [Wyeomyia smithii]
MEKSNFSATSFDEITVSSLSDLRLESSGSVTGVTISDFDSQQQQQQHQRLLSSPFQRETSQPGNNSSSENNPSQQRNNGNAENNLNRQRKSPKEHSHNLDQQQPMFNPSKHLDVWLANAIRGLESGGPGQDSSDQLDSPTLKGSFAEPLSLPPNLNYIDGSHLSSSTSGLFSPIQQQQSPVPNIIPQQFLPHQYHRFGSCLVANDGSEFASLPPRINHHPSQNQQTPPIGQLYGRKAALQQQNSGSSFHDLLSSQRVMTDPYINDSSDNESKNSCAKSKQEMAEALLADLNMLNASTSLNNNGSAGGTPGGNNGGGFIGGMSSGNTSNNQNNLVLVLLKEISKLHDTNKKICRNLHETKGNYTPGIVTDVIREIREVSRVREEALMERMKTMIEERSWALNEANFRLQKESEEMKKSIHSVRSEMNQIVDRMLKLENEVINLKAQLNHQQQQQQFAALRERDSFVQGLPTGGNSAAGSQAAANKLRRNSLHLNYGRISNADEFYSNNFADASGELRYSNGSNMRKFGENNFGSAFNGGGGFSEEMHADPSNDQVLLLEKDAFKLRRELQDALASKQESENRITALENIVSTLKEQVPQVTPMVSTHQQQQHHGSIVVHHQAPLATPGGLLATNNGVNDVQQQQSTTGSFFLRNSNNASPGIVTVPTLHQLPKAASPKPQKAAQVQSLVTPTYVHLTSGGISVTGPVTDL